ncbi:MAG: GTPase Era [Desulfobulbus propionicus]|nr:MAG: GTPase Era [Desulfobulbus propionicus]
MGSSSVTDGHRSGIVTLLGPPNAGKSTLLNRLLGQKITIVTPRPQTTRNRITGIITGADHQIVLVDTPGLHRPRELINQQMVRAAMESIKDADLALFIVDAADTTLLEQADRASELREYLVQINCPVLLVVNKIDLLSSQQCTDITAAFGRLHSFAAVQPISASRGDNTDLLLRTLVEMLPEGPQYYPEDIPTDASERFIVAEIIREQVFLKTRQEVPYKTAVLIDAFQEPEQTGPVIIHASILVERSTQKGILIGHQGRMLADIRTSATRQIERLLDCQVRLRLWIKVKKKWTENEALLRELGLG